MTIRRFIASHDYPVVKTWWEKRGTPAPQLPILPAVGVVVEDEGTPIACAFLYEDKAGVVAMVEWEATNPSVGSPMKVVKGLHMVFEFFEIFAREQGYSVVLSWVAEDRGDGRILEGRKWKKCPGERHALMAFETKEEAPCQQLS